MNRVSREEQAVEDVIGETVARFSVSECERVLADYRAGRLTISETLWTLTSVSSLGCQVILRGWAGWHEARAS